MSVYVIYPRYEIAKYLITTIPITSEKVWILESVTFIPKYTAYQVSSIATSITITLQRNSYYLHTSIILQIF